MTLRRSLLLFLPILVLPLMGPKGSRAERSLARGELGRAYLSEGSIESAIGALREAVELDRSNWAAWTFLGLALGEKGQVDEAEKAFSKAIKLAGDRAEPHLNYGLFLFSQGRAAEAISEYEAALQDLTYRKPALVLNNMGFALMSQGDHERAISVLREATTRAPNLCMAQFNLGLALQAAERVPDAIKKFEDVVHVCGEEAPGAYLQLARLQADLGQSDVALDYLDRLESLVPDSEVVDSARELRASLER
jgi:type IV pilus biogenesis/stability protein PilW